MHTLLKTVVIAAIFSIAALFFANFVLFILDFAKKKDSESWSYLLKEGRFYKNNTPLGVALGSSKGNGLMLFAFAYSLFRSWRLGKLKQVSNK